MSSLEKTSSVVAIALSKSKDRVSPNELLPIALSFKIDGEIRSSFEQRNWERAYNKYDNIFRLSTEVIIKSARKMLASQKFVRKAVIFWTRNPKIPHRIWIMIVKDDNTFYPSTVDEARALLFDIDKIIELNTNDLKPGKHKLIADISVSWGKHLFSNPSKIRAKSNEIEIFKERKA